jgi:hypothetical protein
MLGKKRYEVATVEKKMEMNESSLKLRESIPMRSAFARKKKIIGMSGRMMRGDAPMYRVRAAQITSIPMKYGRAFPMMIDDARTGMERRISPLRSILSFMTLIMKNWEVKYSGNMKIKTRIMESNGSGGDSCDGVLKLPIAPLEERASVYREICVFCAFDWTSCARS